VVAQLIEALRSKPGRSWVQFPIASLEFFIDVTHSRVVYCTVTRSRVVYCTVIHKVTHTP